MPGTDLDLLIGAAKRAGDIATGFSRDALNIRDKSGGAGPVTAADEAVNDALFDILRTARPDYGWLSEESTDSSERQDRSRVFVVDPIDGTRSFIEGGRTWSHSIAIVENGSPIAGVVFAPRLDRLFAAQKGSGATLNGEAIRVAGRSDLAGADILATKPTFDPVNWTGTVPEVNRHHRPSLAYRMCLVAQGRYDAMLTLRPSWEWDIAAGAIILSEAGAALSDRHGGGLAFNNRHPQSSGVVAANPLLHAGLLAQLAPAA